MLRSARVIAVLFGAGIALRGLDFLRHSLHWPLSICLDALILRFESWSMWNGIWPWRDIVSINLPVTHYIHIAGMLIFGTDDFAFRLLDAAYILFTASLTALYLARYSRLSAWIGFALVLCLPHEATPYGAFQREILMLPFWLATLWWAEEFSASLQNHSENSERPLRSYWTDPARARAYIFPGVVAVLTVAIKPTSAPLFLFIGAALLAMALRTPESERRIRPGQLLRGLPIALGTAAVVLGLVFAPLFFSDPNLPRDFLSSWLNQTGAYAAVIETISPLELLARLFTFDPLRWTLALNQPLHGPADTGHLSQLHLVVFGMWFYLARRRKRSLLFALFALAALLQYLLQMRGFQYHLYPLWYAFVLCAALVIGDLLHATTRWRLAGASAGLVLLVSLGLQQHASLKTYRGTGLYDRGHPERIPRFRVPERIGELARVIRRNRGQEGPAAELYFQTFEHATIALGAAIPHRLRLASRYPVDYIVWEPSDFRGPARADMLESLERNRPELIAYAAGHDSLEASRLERWPALKEWVTAGYRRHERIEEVNGDEYWIFVRRDLNLKE